MKTIQAEFAALIDVCSFGVVKAYFRDPQSEITVVLLVQGDYRLKDLAALCYGESPGQPPVEAFQQLLHQGLVQCGVDDMRGVRPGFEYAAVMLDDIADHRQCAVIYLPPAYIVQLL